MTDPRRNIPRTDTLLELVPHLSPAKAKQIIREVQDAARAGDIPVADVEAEVKRRAARTYSLHPVLNATGVIIHTNLGRAPLAPAAVNALVAAAGYTDVELDMDTGTRGARGVEATQALLAACPAEDALVVNNGAAALLLATAALGKSEVIISRGELIEIGAGFRLPELIESTPVRLREVGATNRTHLHDYAAAIGDNTGAILKVHPSNFRMEGFTSSVGVAPLRRLADEHGLALIVDLGSGLLRPDAVLPQEPALIAQLDADVVIASGDKLLGGPQAGILLGKKAAISAIRTHPLARAVRIDKLRLNALEASVNTPNAVQAALHISPQRLLERTRWLQQQIPGSEVVEHAGRVGGGGAPEYPLEGWALALPAHLARPLRLGEPAVLPRVHEGRCLIDLRCIPESADTTVAQAIKAAACT
ncbi:L-seryl-tRNA(Sec) selenium transferase [Corynebacterium lizhenjunii]|uniref:L-seryl-tRNA(Sec) selenium transferase n=1 Tax=Corynebacterium lizhenjunii TaxID=2709394 RepID=UPI00197E5176|nr:L-seryl-tRNA(Sec) selenium transferase [Corynebacterium lizhenjunii]